MENEISSSQLSPYLKEEKEMQITQNLSLSSLIVNVASAKIALIGLTNGYTTIVTSLVGTTSSGNKHIYLFAKSPAYSHTLSILGTTIRRESKRISYNRRSIDDVVNPTFDEDIEGIYSFIYSCTHSLTLSFTF